MLNVALSEAAATPDSVATVLQDDAWSDEKMTHVSQYLETHAGDAGALVSKLDGENARLRGRIDSLSLEKRLLALSSILETCKEGKINKNVAFSYINPFPDETSSCLEGSWRLACYYSAPGVGELYRYARIVFEDQGDIVSGIDDVLSGKVRENTLKSCFWFPDEYKMALPLQEGSGYWDFIPSSKKRTEKEQAHIIQEYWKEVNSVYDTMLNLYFRKISKEQGITALRKNLKCLHSRLDELQNLRGPEVREVRERLVDLFRDKMVATIVPMIWTIKTNRIKSGDWGNDIGKLIRDFEYYQIPDCYLYEDLVLRSDWSQEVTRMGKEMIEKLKVADGKGK